MKWDKNIIVYVILVVVIILIFMQIEGIINPRKELHRVEYVTIRDTITKINVDTMILKYPVVKTKTLYKIDTLIITEAFEKSVDTTFADSSRLQISYFYPGDTFKIKLQTAIQEILIKDSIKTWLPITVDRPKDYTTPIIVGTAGVIGGLIIGVIIAK